MKNILVPTDFSDCAGYALHRQLPYGVPGAYRIAANLLALNKTR